MFHLRRYLSAIDKDYPKRVSVVNRKWGLADVVKL